MSPQTAAMAIGVLGTSVIHLSKGMARHAVQQIGAARDAAQKRAARLFYLLAIIINHSNPIWIIWANTYAAPTRYTSMYGFGLVVLLLYSLFVLGERLEPRQLTGALIILGGTAALGILTGESAPLGVQGIRTGRALLSMAGAVVATAVLLLSEAARTRGATSRLEIVAGVLAGLLASFDPLLKAMGQSGPCGNTILPSTAVGWILYLASFVIALVAFLVTQWGFFRGCRAAILVAAFNATYVTAPIVVLSLSLPGYRLSGWAWASLVLINAGILAIRSPGHGGTPRGGTPARDNAAPAGSRSNPEGRS
jgi:drug/metabolite transporter (DMT)-like permease